MFLSPKSRSTIPESCNGPILGKKGLLDLTSIQNLPDVGSAADLVGFPGPGRMGLEAGLNWPGCQGISGPQGPSLSVLVMWPDAPSLRGWNGGSQQTVSQTQLGGSFQSQKMRHNLLCVVWVGGSGF